MALPRVNFGAHQRYRVFKNIQKHVDVITQECRNDILIYHSQITSRVPVSIAFARMSRGTPNSPKCTVLNSGS